MGRVEGKIATGRTHPIEGNKPLTEGNRSFFKLLACCFWKFFTSFFCQVFNNDCALMTQLKVAFYRSFFVNFLLHLSIRETGRFSGSEQPCIGIRQPFQIGPCTQNPSLTGAIPFASSCIFLA